MEEDYLEGYPDDEEEGGDVGEDGLVEAGSEVRVGCVPGEVQVPERTRTEPRGHSQLVDKYYREDQRRFANQIISK